MQGHVLAVIFGRPAEQAEKIDEGFGEKSGVAVGGDADDWAMAALGKLGAVGRDQQRQMRELRRRTAGGFEDQHVFESIGEMVLAADDVGDAQVGVVGAGGEVVSRHAVGAQQGEVFDVGGGLYLLAVNRISKSHDLPPSRGTRKRKANGSPAAARRSLSALREFARARIEQPGSLRARFFGVPGVSRSEVAVGKAFLENRPRGLAVQIDALGLFVFFVPA